MISECEIELVRATLDDRQRQIRADRAADAALATTNRPGLIQRLLARFSAEPRQQARLRSQLA